MIEDPRDARAIFWERISIDLTDWDLLGPNGGC